MADYLHEHERTVSLAALALGQLLVLEIVVDDETTYLRLLALLLSLLLLFSLVVWPLARQSLVCYVSNFSIFRTTYRLTWKVVKTMSYFLSSSHVRGLLFPGRDQSASGHEAREIEHTVVNETLEAKVGLHLDFELPLVEER